MFRSLNWRTDRVEHIAEHGVTPVEVEQAVFEDAERLLIKGSRSLRNPQRFIYYNLGRTAAGRYVTVVLLDEGSGQALPVSAGDMDAKERRRYRG